MKAIVKLYNHDGSREDWEPALEYTVTLPDGTELRDADLRYNGELTQLITKAGIAQPGEEYFITITEVKSELDEDTLANTVFNDLVERFGFNVPADEAEAPAVPLTPAQLHPIFADPNAKPFVPADKTQMEENLTNIGAYYRSGEKPLPQKITDKATTVITQLQTDAEGDIPITDYLKQMDAAGYALSAYTALKLVGGYNDNGILKISGDDK